MGYSVGLRLTSLSYKGIGVAIRTKGTCILHFSLGNKLLILWGNLLLALPITILPLSRHVCQIEAEDDIQGEVAKW